MSTVTLQIGGKSYAVACADGEEAHIAKLGAMIDAKFAQMGDNLAPQEVQNFLFASLILADEVHEAQKGSPPAATPAPEGPDEDKGKGGKKSELRAEIEQLKHDQAELQHERDVLARQLKEAQELVETATAAAEQAAADAAKQQPDEAADSDQQHDMFGEDVLAARLEALASQAEACAEALEGTAPAP